MKYSKIQELEVEIHAHLEENFRLKALLISSDSSKTKGETLEEPFPIQHRLIIELKENLKKAQLSKQKLDEENIKLQVENELCERKTNRYLEEIKSLKKGLGKMKEENQVLKEENISLSV